VSRAAYSCVWNVTGLRRSVEERAMRPVGVDDQGPGSAVSGSPSEFPGQPGIQHAEPHVVSALVSRRAELAGEGLERQAASPAR
jgi:hypothetical protein